jgi:diguanylate cyclase (GGDEF)-like protein
VLLSDLAVRAIAPDIVSENIVASVKGFGFVAVTTVMLFILIRRQFADVVQAHDKARSAESLFHALAGSLDDMVITFDRDLRITSLVGPTVTPANAELMVGARAADIFGAEVGAPFTDAGRRVIEGESVSVDWSQELAPSVVPSEQTVTSLHIGLVPLRDATGSIIGGVGVGRDTSQVHDLRHASEAAQARISFLVHYDDLTGLPNRMLMESRLTEAIAIADRRQRPLFVWYVDVHDLKDVNDTLGHVVGDSILKQVADRLRDAAPPRATVARMGGDGFMVAGGEIGDREEAAGVAERFGAIFRAPFHTDEREISMRGFVGIAAFPEDGVTPADLHRASDAAMNAARLSGSSHWAFFDREMTVAARERLELANDLKEALEAGKVTAVFQPIMRAADAKIVAFEALARWEHPVRGTVAPKMFIPVAESGGLIQALDESIRRQAFRWLRGCHDRGHPELRLHVNVSPLFLRGSSVEILLAEAASARVAPDRIVLEVTESALIDRAGGAFQALQDLSDAGFVLAVDDFGTGYSSLNYLRDLPFSEIKIDTSFIEDLADERGRAVVETTADLARRLGYRVVQEGVETPEQLAYVRECRIEEWQGFLAARPLPGDEAFALLPRPAPAAR